jgi:uncharacterized protein
MTPLVGYTAERRAAKEAATMADPAAQAGGFPSGFGAGLGCGIGLHREHYDEVLAERPPVRWFELISDNFMVAGGRPRHVLERVRAGYPVALHGVSMSLGSDEPIDAGYLDRLAALVAEVEPLVVSDHLCWTRLSAHNSHDLLPLPFTEEAVAVAAAKIRRVQDRLGRRILVENVSTYLRFRGSTLSEWEFVAAVAEEADCGLLLDVNNVYINGRNHGFAAADYLAGLPAARVAQFHVAGHEDHGDHVLDTHDHPVAAEVWELFRQAVGRFGPLPTILERDDRVPPLPEVLAEAAVAQRILDEAGR